MTGPAPAGPWVAFSDRQRWTSLSILFFIVVSCYMDRGVLTVLLEPIKQEFQLSDAMLGLLGGAPFAICYALSSIPLARLADRTSRKNVLIGALIVWSIMTGLCGLAGSAVFLVIARMGVGAAEGGATAPSHALVAEYFPPQRRVLPFAVLAAAHTVGQGTAIAAGGWMAHTWGWRTAFFAMAAISMPIAVGAMLILREAPRRQIGLATNSVSVVGEFKTLLRKRSFLLISIGTTVLGFYNFGALLFVPSYLSRTMGLSLSEVGFQFGLATMGGSVLGALIGGAIGNRAARAGDRYLLRVPVVASVLATPLALVTFSVGNLTLFLILVGCLIAIVFGSLPPIFSTVQHVCGSSRRAFASAIFAATVNAFAMTLGPLLTGLLSDLYSHLGARSIQYAILTMTAVLPIAAILLSVAGRHIPADAEA